MAGWGMCLLLLGLALPASAKAHRSEAWARSQFAAAERLREALSGRPAAERTRREYQQVISAYRQVYYGAPTSTKADPSAAAVAELMAEEGRQFRDDDLLRSAIRQYEFLRREYPGSKDRFQALLTIAEIYRNDLGDANRSSAVLEEYLRRYPHHHLAEEARKELAGEPSVSAVHSDARANPDADEDAQDSENSTYTPLKAHPDENPTAAAPGENELKLARVTGIRHWSTPDYTRVAIDLERAVKFESQRIGHPDRIFFDLPETSLVSTLEGKSFDVDDGFLKKIRMAQFERGRTRVVLEVEERSAYNAFLLPNPPRLIIDVHGKGVLDAPESPESAKSVVDVASQSLVKPANIKLPTGPQMAKADVPPSGPGPVAAAQPVIKKTVVDADEDDEDSKANGNKHTANPAADQVSDRALDRTRLRASRGIREARPTARGDRSLIRALGLKIGKIVIDPGHGGHDTGTIGPHGLEEKDLVLDVSKRLGKLLASRLGAEVEYTRRDDTFIPLETRTAIANQDQADLFISIHANSSSDPDARGVETYYLNFTTSADALEVAARENAVSGESIHELQDLVKKIALKEKIEESREFASNVESALHSGLATKNPGIRDRGVKKAPFIVLIGANMPSILAEISFVSNPADERKLKTAEYRQRIAESLYHGIARYVSGLSGVRVATKIDKGAGQ
jgi:N-acetylmuramoyl-L-alanine amidase